MIFQKIAELRELALNNLIERNGYNKIGEDFNSDRKMFILNGLNMNENLFHRNIINLFKSIPDESIREDAIKIKGIVAFLNNLTTPLTIHDIVVYDNIIHGYHGGRQHNGLRISNDFYGNNDELLKVKDIIININKEVKEINNEYGNSFPTSRLKESFSLLSKTYVDLSKVSPRYEFISEACIQKVAKSLKLEFSRDSLYEFDFLTAVDGLKTKSDHDVIKELADTMLHRHLLGGALDTNIKTENIELYNDLYKNDPILGIRKIIKDKDVNFSNPETIKEQEDAINKEPERLKRAMENMENTVNSPKAPGN